MLLFVLIKIFFILVIVVLLFIKCRNIGEKNIILVFKYVKPLQVKKNWNCGYVYG